MQRGYGKTLTEINNSLHTLTDEEAIRMGTNIGQQMGAMTRAFFLTNRTILAHGDFQRPNLMYSKNKEQFYWIDLGGTREIAYIPGGGAQNYEASYFDIETSQVKYIWWAFSPNGRELKKAKAAASAEEKNAILNKHRIGILAGNAFYNGYLEQVRDLDPHQESPQHKDSFIKFIDQQKREYIETVQNVFGEESPRVLSYLRL